MMTPRERSERLYGIIGILMLIVAAAIAVAAFAVADDGEIGFRRFTIRIVVSAMCGLVGIGMMGGDRI